MYPALKNGRWKLSASVGRTNGLPGGLRLKGKRNQFQAAQNADENVYPPRLQGPKCGKSESQGKRPPAVRTGQRNFLNISHKKILFLRPIYGSAGGFHTGTGMI